MCHGKYVGIHTGIQIGRSGEIGSETIPRCETRQRETPKKTQVRLKGITKNKIAIASPQSEKVTQYDTRSTAE